MKRILRAVRQLVVGLTLVLIAALTVIYAISEWQLRERYGFGGRPVEVPTDAASIEEGTRLATIRGCYDGCHGEGYGGEVFIDEPFPFNMLIGRMNAPDLTRLAAERSDHELERSIRRGVNAEGRSVFLMPSAMFQGLSDEDLGKILASIRAAPRTDGLEPGWRLGPMVRYFIMTGDFPLSAAAVDHAAVPPRTAPAAGVELGRYLAMTVCTECHGQDLQGSAGAGPAPAIPSLSIAASYSAEQFAQLMREGEPAGGNELGLMRDVSLSRFTHLTSAEVSALYAFLSDPATWASGGAE